MRLGSLAPDSGRTRESSTNAALHLEAKANQPRVRRVFVPGPKRAPRDSVRWALVSTARRPTSGTASGGPAAGRARAGLQRRHALNTRREAGRLYCASRPSTPAHDNRRERQ